MTSAPTTDLDSLIAELQRLRAEHGNIQTTTVQAGHAGNWWLCDTRVSVISVGLGKGQMKPVSRGGRPVVLLASDT